MAFSEITTRSPNFLLCARNEKCVSFLISCAEHTHNNDETKTVATMVLCLDASSMFCWTILRSKNPPQVRQKAKAQYESNDLRILLAYQIHGMLPTRLQLRGHPNLRGSIERCYNNLGEWGSICNSHCCIISCTKCYSFRRSDC